MLKNKEDAGDQPASRAEYPEGQQEAEDAAKLEEITRRLREAEVLAWGEKEAERRAQQGRDRFSDVELLPEDEFDNEYASNQPYVEGARGSRSSMIESLFAGSCCGWPRHPTTKEFYEAMRAETPNIRQQAIAGVLIDEGTLNEVKLAYLQGAFTWRQLVRMMNRRRPYRGELAAYVNMHARRQ